jgi:ABC-type multidrug transport system fused ATPase/permease subunit
MNLEGNGTGTCPTESEAGRSDSLACSLAEKKRLLTYGILIVSSVTLNFMRGGAFYLICNNAARVLHNRMFKTILRIPVLFFDTNPSGTQVSNLMLIISFGRRGGGT